MPDDTAPTPPAPPPPPPLPTPEPAPAPSTAALTQADLDKAVSAETAKAKRDAHKALADELGMPIEDAKRLVADTKAATEAQLSEVERREKAAEDREKVAAKREADAVARTKALAVKEALIDAGVKPERRDHAMSLVTLEADAGDAEITAAVAKLATDVPEFFGATDPSAPRLPASVPTGGRPAPVAPGDKFAAGEAMAEEFLGRSRTTYFPERAGAPA